MRGLKMVALAVTLLLLPVLSGISFSQEEAPAETLEKSELEKAMEEELRAQVSRDNWLVTMSFRDATVQEIIDEFRLQVNVSIDLDATNIPEDYRVKEFVVRDVPFRQALEAFLEKAQLRIDEDSATLIRLSRPPRVSFNFKDADVRAVLDMIARVADANLVVAPEIQGTISLNIHDIAWNDVLESVVKTLNYTTVREDSGIIRVIHPDELIKQMETKVFPLRYLQPPPYYMAKIDEGSFISGEPPKSITQAEQRLKAFFLLPTLQSVLSTNARGQVVGRLNYDPDTNVFVVTDVKPKLDKITEIIKILDVEPAQVIIDVKFISTWNEELLQFGTNFSFGGSDGATVTNRILNPTPSGSTPTATGPSSGKFTRLPFGLGHSPGSSSQYFLTNYDMLMTFRAYQRDRYSRLLQEPTIAAVDHEMATIFVGEEIAYAEQKVTTNNQTGALIVSLSEASGSPVSVGFQLFIQPQIIPESNKVLMTIIPQNNALSGTTSPDLPGFERFVLQGVGNGGLDASIDLPRISSTTVFSKLLLESGRTAVLGGLVVERTSLEDKKIPILGEIPILGYFFKQTEDSVRKEHLLIFVTPRIVRMNADSERIRAMRAQNIEGRRAKFRKMEGTEESSDTGEGATEK